jgi:serine/threonine protein kinase
MDLLSGKKIQEGKFSIVYLVDHKNEKFIVKQLHPRLAAFADAVERFKAEAELPHFEGVNPRTLDFKNYIGNYYIIREYIPGITLKQLHVKYTRKKYHSRYTTFYIQLSEKLLQLHANGIIHGDIKPSNILWTGNDFKKATGEVRLLDLGLSVSKDQLPQKKKDAPLSFSMMYSAPELMLNEPSLISELADLFSMGICMYESYSGERAYTENHPAILLQMMLAVPLKKRRKIPQHLFELISMLSAKPGFKKPISHYSVDEAKEYLEANLLTRSAIPDVGKLKLKLGSVTTR